MELGDFARSRSHNVFQRAAIQTTTLTRSRFPTKSRAHWFKLHVATVIRVLEFLAFAEDDLVFDLGSSMVSGYIDDINRFGEKIVLMRPDQQKIRESAAGRGYCTITRRAARIHD